MRNIFGAEYEYTRAYRHFKARYDAEKKSDKDQISIFLGGEDMTIGLINVDSHNFPHGLRLYAEKGRKNRHGKRGTVYCLTNYDTTMEENLYRIYTLRDMGYDPYVMIYDKPNAPREIRLLQRWCNNRQIFRAEPDFYKYDPKKRKQKEEPA